MAAKPMRLISENPLALMRSTSACANASVLRRTKTWSGVVQLSPLQLLEYMFEGVSVNPTPGYDNSTRDPSAVVAPSNMTLESECGIADIQDKDAFSDYALKLVLKVTPAEKASAP